MKKLISGILVSAAILLALPWLVVTFVKGSGGMAVCFLLFFAINPIYVVLAGAYAGRNIKSLWPLPCTTAVLFLAGAWLLFDLGERAFLIYGLIYLILGITAMCISAFIKKQ